MRLHFEIKSGVHIHRDNFNVGCIIAELFKGNYSPASY
jgi:hypothetical protein